MTAAQLTAPLSALSIDDINVRKTARAPSPDFVANIAAKGIIEPLIVRINGSGYKIVNGGKRFAALRELQEGGKIADDYPVPIVVRNEDDKDARDTSLSANLFDPMHPVDEFEAFVALKADGWTIEEIARRYGLKRKQVEQALALGAVAPKILDAWRNDKVDRDSVQAFTIEPDQDRQVALFNRLVKEGRGYFNSWQVKQALGGDSRRAASYLAIVGAEAYEAAGGRINKDLFSKEKGDDQIVADMPILARLLDEKVQSERKRLVEVDGWQWAEFDDGHQRYSYDRAFTSKVSAENKKKSGCFLYVDHNGKLVIEGGYVKGRAKAAGEKAAAKKAATKSNPNAISGALERRLNEQKQVAIKQALVADQLQGELAPILAKVVADQIHPGQWNSLPHSVDKAFDKIRDSITPAVMLDHMRKAFDPAGYFAGINAAQLGKCITEMGVVPPYAKKTELIKVASKLVKDTGWLPAQLRTAHYDGPATTSAKKPAAKAKTKKR